MSISNILKKYECKADIYEIHMKYFALLIIANM